MANKYKAGTIPGGPWDQGGRVSEGTPIPDDQRYATPSPGPSVEDLEVPITRKIMDLLMKDDYAFLKDLGKGALGAVIPGVSPALGVKKAVEMGAKHPRAMGTGELQEKIREQKELLSRQIKEGYTYYDVLMEWHNDPKNRKYTLLDLEDIKAVYDRHTKKKVGTYGK